MSGKGSGAGVLGVGAAACAACCAAPIAGALSAIGVATAVGFFVVGFAALAVGAVAAAWLYRSRRGAPVGKKSSSRSN